MSGFKCVPGEELILAASTIAIAIAKEVEDNDALSVLSALVVAIGDNLALIATQRDACPPSKCKEYRIPPLLFNSRGIFLWLSLLICSNWCQKTVYSSNLLKLQVKTSKISRPNSRREARCRFSARAPPQFFSDSAQRTHRLLQALSIRGLRRHSAPF